MAHPVGGLPVIFGGYVQVYGEWVSLFDERQYISEMSHPIPRRFVRLCLRGSR